MAKKGSLNYTANCHAKLRTLYKKSAAMYTIESWVPQPSLPLNKKMKMYQPKTVSFIILLYLYIYVYILLLQLYLQYMSDTMRQLGSTVYRRIFPREAADPAVVEDDFINAGSACYFFFWTRRHETRDTRERERTTSSQFRIVNDCESDKFGFLWSISSVICR